MMRKIALAAIPILLLAACDYSAGFLGKPYADQYYAVSLAARDGSGGGYNHVIDSGAVLAPGSEFGVSVTPLAGNTGLDLVSVSIIQADGTVLAQAAYAREGAAQPKNAPSTQAAALVTDLAQAALPIIVPVGLPNGLYSLRLEIYGEEGKVYERDFPVFITALSVSVASIQVCPSTVRPGAVAVLRAQVEASAEVDPYLVWTHDGEVVDSGLFSTGHGQILWRAPAAEGIYSVTAQVYPHPPADGKPFAFESRYPSSARILVRAPQFDPADPFQPQEGYYSRYRFDGDLDDSGSRSGKGRPKPSGDPGIFVYGPGYGVLFDEDSSLSVGGYPVPVQDGKLGAFSLMGRMMILPRGASDDFPITVIPAAMASAASGSFRLRTGIDEEDATADSLAVPSPSPSSDPLAEAGPAPGSDPVLESSPSPEPSDASETSDALEASASLETSASLEPSATPADESPAPEPSPVPGESPSAEASPVPEASSSPDAIISPPIVPSPLPSPSPVEPIRLASGFLFRAESDSPGFSLELGLGADGQLYLSVADRSRKAVSESGIYPDERVHDLVVSVVPEEGGLYVKWFWDYRGTGESFLEFLPESIPRSGSASFGGQGSVAAVFDEFGVYSLERDGIREPWGGAFAALMRRSMRRGLVYADGFDSISLPALGLRGEAMMDRGALILGSGAELDLPVPADTAGAVEVEIAFRVMADSLRNREFSFAITLDGADVFRIGQDGRYALAGKDSGRLNGLFSGQTMRLRFGRDEKGFYFSNGAQRVSLPLRQGDRPAYVLRIGRSMLPIESLLVSARADGEA